MAEGSPDEATPGTDRPMPFDTGVAHIARVYDCWLGGKDNFAADREAANRALDAYPDMVCSVRANRAFLARVVRLLAREAGIRQFLDIGTGIPTANNSHEVAQAARAGQLPRAVARCLRYRPGGRCGGGEAAEPGGGAAGHLPQP